MVTGFSLVEALVTLFLVGLVLLSIGGIASEYSRLSRFQDSKDERSQAIQMGIERLRAEARESIAVSSPAPGSSALVSQFSFTKLSPTGRLGSPPLTPGSVWQVFSPSDQIQVDYFTDARGLVRRETVGGTPLETPLTSVVEGFAVSYIQNNRSLEFRFSLGSGSAVEQLVTLVERPVKL